MFVGTYSRKVLRGGAVRLPKAWLSEMGSLSSLYVVPDPDTEELCLVPPFEAGLPETAVLCEIDGRGALRLPAAILDRIGAGDPVVLRGAIRMIKVCAARR